MNSPGRIRFLATKPHWHEAWLCIAVMLLSISLMASGASWSWSVALLFAASAFLLFRAVQPRRSYLELSPQGIEIAWGLHRSFIDWRDVSGVRLLTTDGYTFAGVAFTASGRSRDILGCRFATGRASIDGVLRGEFYGTSDWRLYQLMSGLRNSAEPRPESSHELAGGDVLDVGETAASRSREPS